MLTDLQQRILRYIQTHLAQHSRAPTLSEIGKALGLRSKGTIHRYVQALEEKGHLVREPRGWRGIRLAQIETPATLPLAGRIAAGRPIEAIPDQDEINLHELLVAPGRYALRVKGDSMIDAGILDGDVVVVEPLETADDGDIVVALIDDDEATIKRLRYHPNGYIELIPANPDLKPVRYAAKRVRIQGVVVGQLRTYA